MRELRLHIKIEIFEDKESLPVHRSLSARYITDYGEYVVKDVSTEYLAHKEFLESLGVIVKSYLGVFDLMSYLFIIQRSYDG